MSERNAQTKEPSALVEEDIPDAKTPGDLISVDKTWDADGTLGIGVEEDGGRAIVVLDRAGVERLHAILGARLVDQVACEHDPHYARSICGMCDDQEVYCRKCGADLHPCVSTGERRG